MPKPRIKRSRSPKTDPLQTIGLARLVRISIVLPILLISLNASNSQAAQERLWEGVSKSIRGIRISGFNGQVHLTHDEKSSQLTIDAFSRDEAALSSPWKPIVQVAEDGWVSVTVEGPSSKSDWRVPKIPSLDIQVRGRSVPTVIAWKEGDIAVKGWRSPTQITHYKGSIRCDSTRDHFRVTAMEGDVQFLGHHGRVQIDTFRAKVSLVKQDGGTQIHNFSGQIHLDQSKGDVVLRSSKGKNVLEEHKGNIEFNLENGELNLVKFAGSVRGRTDQGAVHAHITGPVDFKVRSETGRVALGVPRSSGARVDLGTEDGNFGLQFPLRADRLENIKLVRGNLPGKDAGSIFVRSKSGDIRLRPQ